MSFSAPCLFLYLLRFLPFMICLTTQRAAARAAALWAALFLLSAPPPAWAYLDPGTGSMLLSIIVGLASSGYFFIRNLPSLMRRLLFRVQGKSAAAKCGSIVFYAESAAYWGTFEPVLCALAAMGEKALYLTSDEKDPAFKANLPGIEVRYIGKGNAAYTMLGFLEADVFALTTPGIDVLQIRRSKGVKKYVHLVHAATDAHGYKLYSFDYYDAVFCSGPHQQRSLRHLEAVRGTAPKYLPLVGCAYFDRLCEARRTKPVSMEQKTVLIAPTWGKAGLLTKTGASIPKALALAGWHVILRPHPQSFVSEAERIAEIEKELKDIPNIEWDRRPNGFESLSRASVMISDFSGVVFDYAFVFERPVVTIGSGWVDEGYEAFDLPEAAWEMSVLEKIGIHLKPGEEDRVVDAAETLWRSADAYRSAICEIRSHDIVHFGAAGKPIAEELVKLAHGREEATAC